MSKKVKMILVDVETTNVTEVEIEPTLSNYYRLLNCDCIDMPERQINGEYFDIICDDEGLLTGKKLSAIDSDGNPMLVGNLLITKCNYEGEDVGLTDAEISKIKKLSNFRNCVFSDGSIGILLVCEY